VARGILNRESQLYGHLFRELNGKEEDGLAGTKNSPLCMISAFFIFSEPLRK
jgi:hypothetical protein